mmetsp:Transcript_8677/g.19914  ORF Transcript_8677/g.19914 Transcript_8677/m.19914 type:complete len:210 (+) Transcript_8677:1-630(+)
MARSSPPGASGRAGTATPHRPATGASRRSAASVGSRGSERSFASGSRASDAAAPPWAAREARRLPQVGTYAVTGLPGYSGHVPGKVSENVCGHTFRVANEQAVAEGTMRSRGLRPPDALEMGRTHGPLPGTDIPGYMGFVPGRYADNVLGTNSTRAAETAWHIKEQQALERRHRVSAYRRGERPQTGYIDYTGYNPAGATSRMDSAYNS